MANEFYTRSLALSLAGHLAILGVCLFAAVVQGCRYRRKPAELIEFTVAIEPDTTEASVAEKADASPPERLREPPPPPPPPVIDAIADPQAPVRKPEEKPPPVRTPEERRPAERSKPEERRTPEPPRQQKKPVEKGRRVVRGPAQNKPARQTLSDEEIRKWLGQRARIGTSDSLPDSERARNFNLVREVLYEAWEQPSRAEAGVCPAEVEFEIDASGRILSPRIVRSSGSPVFDASVLEAVRRAGRVPGLSPGFLRAYPRLRVEFKLAE
jgi:protein TonB